MRVSLRWLGEYVDLPEDVIVKPDAVAQVLNGLGHEVEAVEYLEAPFRGVVVARVVGRRPHPAADRLQLVEVDAGDRQVEVVCGAWNFDTGALVPLALPGATLAGALEVGERRIRGVQSVGMICSEAELGLGEDEGGIMVLPPGPSIGADMTAMLPYPDVVLDVSITSNRPDCMSMVGLARELAAYYRTGLRRPEVQVKEAPPPLEVEVGIDDLEACPRYVARPIRGVRVGPSPAWLRLRLQAAGLRSINNVVDATNYVLLELGQPLHAFDLDRLAGHTIVVRRARAGETLRTLDGLERRLDPADLVIADAERPVGLAGVMGGEDAEVGGETSDVLIESAYFDPPTVLGTAKRHGLRTEASSRFERGVDPNNALLAADRVAGLLAQVSGGRPAEGVRDVYPRPVRAHRVAFPLGEVPRLLGIEVPPAVVMELLERLEMKVTGRHPLTVIVPTFRPDLSRPADLVEEVARLYGYDQIPETLPKGTGGGLPDRQQRLRLLRQVLVGAGYYEAQTLSFLSPADLDGLGLEEGDPRRSAIEVTNPLREEEGVLRTTLLPGLLQAAAYNQARRVGQVSLFEIGKVFLRDPLNEGNLPEQPDLLAFVSNRGADVHDATGLWELVARSLGAATTGLQPQAGAPFHPGRSAQVLVDGRPTGRVGELHPSVVRAFGLAGRVVAGEIELDPLLEEPGWWQLAEPSPFPPVVFDLAFELPEGAPAGELLQAVREAAGQLLEEASIFDVFRGSPLPPDAKSLALRLRLRAPDHTLTDDEVAVVRQTIATRVAERLGGRLRGGLPGR
ncbi:MAG: phenylalanine--tRNA ligase subunit beta [Actinomycetota bacterium]|nr:phenylalanine--tRNA ligase subunit beta [Actinomycetota bacterium]